MWFIKLLSFFFSTSRKGIPLFRIGDQVMKHGGGRVYVIMRISYRYGSYHYAIHSGIMYSSAKECALVKI